MNNHGEDSSLATSAEDDDVTGNSTPQSLEGDMENRELNGDDVEDGLDISTHGGGELEEIEGFDGFDALTLGIGARELAPIDTELAMLPRSCDLEFEGVPETVCGADDRVHVTRVGKIPWRMICQLIITRGDGRRSRCTGWFISPRTVMTAGHCVYSHAQGAGWAKSIEVIPGMNGRARPFGSATGTTFKSVKGWTKKQRPSYDYGCIILPKASPLGSKTGYFGFANLRDDSLRDLIANNSGYPGDKPFGTQWYNAGRISDISAKRFTYMLDTAGGQSGSPTWRYSKGKRHAIGVHAYGGCPNKSTRINRPVFDNMKRWKQLGV